MNATTHFKNTLLAYLGERAKTDILFEFVYTNPKKNIDDCVTYILNEVKNSGCNGFTDDEIYSKAVHYYDEATIDIGKPVNCKVVVNHTVVLTEEEKAEAHQQALEQAKRNAYTKMTSQKSKSKQPSASNQLAMF